MRVGRIIERTRAEGPGQRFTIWVQGCKLNCPGCYAKSLQNPGGGTQISVEDILSRLAAVREGLEGITLLGGEPFLQAEELSAVAAQAQAWGLSVLTFTGFLLEDLRNGTECQKKLLAYTDVLLDGPYLQDERDFSRPLVGSRNQRILFLSERYTISDILNYRNRVEVRISGRGEITLNGMGDFTIIEQELANDGLIGGNGTDVLYRI